MRHPAMTMAIKMAYRYFDLVYLPREVFSKSNAKEYSEIRQFCIAWVVSSKCMPDHEAAKAFDYKYVEAIPRNSKRAYVRFGHDPRFLGLMDTARIWGENHKRKIGDKAQLLRDAEERSYTFQNGIGWSILKDIAA